MKVQTVPCGYDDRVTHEYPEDWIFGGANNSHPGADPRYVPKSYTYYSADLEVLTVRSSFTCDEQALFWRSTIEQQYRTKVAWIQVQAQGDEKPHSIWKAVR